MNGKISRAWLTAAIENMGGHVNDVQEFQGDVAVSLDEERQVAMFAVEVSRQAAFEAVDGAESQQDAEGRTEDYLDRVVNLFDDARATHGREGVLVIFGGWTFES